MKLVGAIGAAVLSLSLGVGIPAYAQQEQHDQQEDNKDKPVQDKDKEKKAEPEKSVRQEDSKPDARQEEKNKPEEKTAQHQAKPEQKDQHAGGRIPADRYKANFGREHTFRVSEGDYRNHRFQYGGYWFGFASTWPSNWLYTQDVYVVEINGVYYLCNATYPGVNLALNITL
jgi:hypothetical protein